MTLGIMTFSILTYSITINKTQHEGSWQSFSFIMLSVVILNVANNPFMLSGIMLSVMATYIYLFTLLASM